MTVRAALRGFLVFWLLAASAQAQQPPALSLTLEDAQQRALAASHRLAEARAREVAALGDVASLEAADRPIVALLGGFTRTNHVLPFSVPGALGVPRLLYPDVPSNYRTRIDLLWPIYSGGRLDALERAAAAEASAVAADIQAAQADLRLEVSRAFWSLVTARAAVTVLEQAVQRAQAHVADVRQRFNAGLVPPNDVALTEAQESRERLLLIEAVNQRGLSSAELARLTNIDLLQPIEPAATLDAAFDAPAYDALVVDARANRQDRRGLELRVASGEFQQVATARNLRPTISVTGGYDFARPNPNIFPRTDEWQRSFQLNFNVAWSLWDWGRTDADVAKAAALTDAARERLAEFDSILGLELRQRLLEIDSGRQAIAAADDGVRAATEARRVVGERYTVGVATSTEVLDAEVALLQAELDRTRALAALKLANARLDRARGR